MKTSEALAIVERVAGRYTSGRFVSADFAGIINVKLQFHWWALPIRPLIRRRVCVAVYHECFIRGEWAMFVNVLNGKVYAC